MLVKLKLIFLILPMLAVLAQPVLAETAERPAPAGGVLSLLPPPQTTNHSITLAGRKLDYQAKAATLSLLSGNGDVTAEIFYVAYTLEPPASVAKDPQRPITFVFNGGPGAASAYLHLGALGPRIIATGADGELLPSPQRLIDNPDSWLDMTDLVFVDPVGTGYSREAPGQDTRDFWGVNQDASSIGAFIRLYLAQNGRTGSPLFLAGESYGGFRAALLART
ncbi:peptidase S10, partial [Mesorhizobium sp. M7A.T.Ca.US.000.02.2.1]